MQRQLPRSSRWPWIGVALLMAAAFAWLFWPRAGQPPAAPPKVLTSAPLAQPSAPIAGDDTGAIRHPIANELGANELGADAAIPALADSDNEAWSALSGLVGNDAALGLLLRDHLIQRLVVLVDNLPQRSVPGSVLPYRPLQDPIRTLGEPGTDTPASLDRAANASRYAGYVEAFSRVDPAMLAASYRRFYPLFQQAYVELGYPQGYFNDRLVQVIDHLLQTPELAQAPLVEPNGRGKYRFSDPALESLSVGQKALLRLTPEQAVAVKGQLRAIRAAITAG